MCAQGGCVCTSLHVLNSLTRLTQLRMDIPYFPIASSSLQCLSALRRLRDLDIGLLGRQYMTRLVTVPPLPHCTALTRLKWLDVPTQVHIHKRLAPNSHPCWVLRGSTVMHVN